MPNLELLCNGGNQIRGDLKLCVFKSHLAKGEVVLQSLILEFGKALPCLFKYSSIEEGLISKQTPRCLIGL